MHILVATDDTVVVGVVEAGEEVTVLVAAGEAEAVLLAPCRLRIGVDPILVDDAAGVVMIYFVFIIELFLDVTGVVRILIVEVSEQVGTVHHGVLAEALEDGPSRVGDGSLTLGAALRGHEDDAVTRLGTVDGGGGGVLQDLDGLDQGRVQILDAAYHEAVHYIERTLAGARGRNTADADRGSFARGAVGDDTDTGGAALEGGCGVGGGLVTEGFGADGRHGTGQVALLDHAVTDDHGLFEHLSVFFEDDVEAGLVADCEDLRLETDAFDGNVGSGRDGQRECAVKVRCCADSGVADHGDGRADDRFSSGIHDFAADGSVLGGSREASERSEKYHGDTCHLHQMF